MFLTVLFLELSSKHLASQIKIIGFITIMRTLWTSMKGLGADTSQILHWHLCSISSDTDGSFVDTSIDSISEFIWSLPAPVKR